MPAQLYAHEIRRAVFEAVPEYKPLKRLKVSGNATGGEIITILLQTGLMTKDATDVFDRVGTLKTNMDKIVGKLDELYGVKVKGVESYGYDYRYRGENYYLHLQ